MQNVIILGPQGSGKGTQAQLLADEFGYVMIGAGESLREIAKEETELGQRVRTKIDKGILVEPEVIAEVVEAQLRKVPLEKPVVIDGFPRTREQYQLMKEFWPSLKRGDFLVLYLTLSEEESLKRLGNRYTCERCGEIYNGFVKNGVCAKCGGKLVQRDDETPEAIRSRLAWTNTETKPMVEEMQREGKVVVLDGAPGIPAVHAVILKTLQLS